MISRRQSNLEVQTRPLPFRDNFVKLEVFFTDLYEEVIEQIPAYGFWNLLGESEIHSNPMNRTLVR